MDGYDETLLVGDWCPQDGIEMVAEYDYLDAPEWALERLAYYVDNMNVNMKKYKG